MFEELLAAIVDDVFEDYRIDREDARALLEPLLAKDAKLGAAMKKAKDLDALRRTRAFKDARKKARHAVYYALRQYKRDDLASLVAQLSTAAPEDAPRLREAILAAHSSTRERSDEPEGPSRTTSFRRSVRRGRSWTWAPACSR